MTNVNNLDLSYDAKLNNIKKNYDKIKEHFISILSESNSKLDTYKIIYIQINKVIEYINKFNNLPNSRYLYFSCKYRNSVNALINLIFIKEIELEEIRSKTFMKNIFLTKDICHKIKSFNKINKVESFLANCMYPKLLSILEEAKNSFKTFAN